MLDLLLVLAAAHAAHAGPAAPAPVAPDPRAAALAVVDTALARMGGAEALARIERVRFETMTQWQRLSFDERPYVDQPSYEWHADVRDYTLGAWRNTRRFVSGGTWREIVDVVRDSVAVRRMNGAWAPLNVAYVDERRELFAFTPDRLLLAARAAADLRALPDTTIGGQPHARVSATVDRFPATIFFRRGDGLLAMARWRAAHPNDFGLVPWGEMEVEIWYSGWRSTPKGVALPMQWDVRRVGRPYKRMTIVGAQFDSVAAADSFAVSDSLRRAYFASATATRPMHDLPFDSARVVGDEGRFVSFGTFGAPAGAVKLGRRWVLLEAGQAPLSAERAVEWLARTDGGRGAAPAGAIVSMPSGQGGAAWLASRRVPLHVAPGMQAAVGTILRNHGRPASAAAPITAGRWLRIDGDSLWVEPIDLPDAPGSLLVYVPSLEWAYSGLALAPLQTEYVLRRLGARGWPVKRLGSARAVAGQVPSRRP